MSRHANRRAFRKPSPLAAAVQLLLVAVPFVAAGARGDDKGQAKGPAWEKVWQDAKADAIIRGLVGQVSVERMRKHLFHLSKDPLPFRKLNFTLPGHEKNTLYEADDYLAGKLQSWGYQVRREGVRVQAFRRDASKPKHAQYSPPKPEDPWYTAYNVYAEKRGRSHPEEIILALAHKDSQSWVDSPGANDNAIGTVGVLEMACVLAKYAPERTVRFLFCNEEHTPWTSVTAAQNARKRGDRIIAVFNLDGIGVKGPEETKAGKKTNVTLYTVPEGEPLAKLMSAAAARYAPGLQQRIAKRPRAGRRRRLVRQGRLRRRDRQHRVLSLRRSQLPRRRRRARADRRRERGPDATGDAGGDPGGGHEQGDRVRARRQKVELRLHGARSVALSGTVPPSSGRGPSV